MNDDDAALLSRYAHARDERAFAQLVERHVALVHTAALRQVNGDAHLAADVTQLVFTDLARKARALAGHRVLAGWLFTSTRFAAAKIVRGEQRRRRREMEAHMRNEPTDAGDAALDWHRVRPILDEAIAELKVADREAILLRFFENRDFAEVGARLNVAANAARMRVERALDRLRAALKRRGVTSTTAAIATVLSAHAVTTAPAGLASTVVGPALAAGGGGALAAYFMSMTKLQIGLASVLAVAGTTGYVVQARANAELRREAVGLRQTDSQIAALRAENARLHRTAAEAADLRGDNAAFAQAAAEAGDLKARLVKVSEQKQAQEAARSAASSADIFDLAALDQLPKPLARVAPKYPMELRRAGITGKAVVDFIVDSNGDVQRAYAVDATRPEFGTAAVEAVGAWKFAAGRKGGRSVNTHMQVPIVFSLNATPPAQPVPRT